MIPKWAHFGHGWIWISIIVVIALWSIGRGFQKHKSKSVLLLAFTGLLLLVSGTLLEDKISIITESLIFVSGGVLLTVAHWKNYKLEGACDFKRGK